MRRPVLFLALLLPALAVGQAQPVADRVTFHAKDGKLTTLTGEVKEAISGVQVIIGGQVKQSLTPAEVVRIDPTDLPGLNRLELQKAQTYEDGRDPVRAAAEFAELARKAGTNERARRYALFREAVWEAKVADSKGRDEFPAAAARAVGKLEVVARGTRRGWECWPAGRLAARLHLELGEFSKAAALYADLAAAELPSELKAEAKLDEAVAYLRAGQKGQVTAALSQANPELLADRRAVLTAAISGNIAKLQAAIDTAKDPVAKAVGYNLLADALLAAGKPRDALWARLWVDAVYNQSPEERVMAVRRLADQFAASGDTERAEQFRSRLREVR